MIENIIKLSLINGVSGREGAVCDYIENALSGVCEMERDALGNLFAFKKGKREARKKIMLTAHMDEVGFIVTAVKENGMLKFSACGGVDSRVTVGRRVTVGENAVLGVIGTKAVHQKSDKEKEEVLSLDKLFIDIGAKDKKEALNMINIGDTAAFEGQYIELGGDMFTVKALDDRAGCGILMELLKEFDEFDIHCVFTVQEETGLAGGKVAANRLKPDIGIAVETTTAGDVGGTKYEEQVCRVGDGGVVSFMDKGTIYDYTLYRTIMDNAKAQSIPAQTKEGVYGGNESRVMQVAGNGVKVAAISMPCRYLHSATCLLKKQDIENTFKLIKSSLIAVEAL